MNESSRKPTTGTRYPTLFDKWNGIFYMLSRTDTAEWTHQFFYPFMDHWGGGSQSAPAQGSFETPTCRSTVEHANHETTTTAPKSEDQSYPGSSTEGSSLYWGGGSSAKIDLPRVGHSQGVDSSKVVLIIYFSLKLCFANEQDGNGMWKDSPKCHIGYRISIGIQFMRLHIKDIYTSKRPTHSTLPYYMLTWRNMKSIDRHALLRHPSMFILSGSIYNVGNGVVQVISIWV